MTYSQALTVLYDPALEVEQIVKQSRLQTVLSPRQWQQWQQMTQEMRGRRSRGFGRQR